MNIKTSLTTMGVISGSYIVLDLLYRGNLRGSNQCVLNEGIAFGIDILPQRVILMISVLLIGTVSWLIINAFNERTTVGSFQKDQLLEFGLYLMILSGAFVNTIERVMYGNICDYLSFPVYGHLMINLSDVFVISGGISLLYLYFRKYATSGLDNVDRRRSEN